MSTLTHSSLIINTDTLQYPVSISQIRRENPTVSLPALPTVAQIEALGYAVVKTVPRPVADVVTEGKPALIDGVWTQVWETREFNSQELSARLNAARETRKNELKEYRERVLYKGHPFDFNGVIGHVQLRDGDRANITGLRVKAESLVRAGVTDPVMFFRTYENEVHYITPEQMIALSDFAFDAYNFSLQHFWDLETELVLAETIEELPEVPVEPPVFVANNSGGEEGEEEVTEQE